MERHRAHRATMSGGAARVRGVATPGSAAICARPCFCLVCGRSESVVSAGHLVTLGPIGSLVCTSADEVCADSIGQFPELFLAIHEGVLEKLLISPPELAFSIAKRFF